jgi:two-component system, sensor histidine kinase and response regulator
MVEETQRRRILVADDNEHVRQLLADMCRMIGYEVDVVSDGLAATEAAATTSYDAILMDCHMPVLDGFDATRRIRDAGAARAAPVIIAVTGDGSREECLAAGMNDHLRKPVRPPTLQATLTRWLAPGAAAAPARPSRRDG